MAGLFMPVNMDLNSYVTLAQLRQLNYVQWDAIQKQLLDGNLNVISGVPTVQNYSDLPSYATSNGWAYVVLLPTPVVYYSNGSGWYQIGGNTPMYLWSAFPSANTVAFGTTFKIDPASFGGTYKNMMGVDMVSDGTNWRPKDDCQLLARQASAVAAPGNVATGAGATDVSFDIAQNFSMPAGLLSYVGIGIRVNAYFMKTGLNILASTFKVKIGKNNSAVNADEIYRDTSSAILGRECKAYQTARVTRLTSVSPAVAARLTSDTTIPNSQGTSLAFDQSSFLDTNATNYVLFTAAGAIGAGHALLTHTIELLG